MSKIEPRLPSTHDQPGAETRRIPYVLFAFLVVASFPCQAIPATITIDADKDLVPVNPLLFGTNLHANDESGEPVIELLAIQE